MRWRRPMRRMRPRPFRTMKFRRRRMIRTRRKPRWTRKRPRATNIKLGKMCKLRTMFINTFNTEFNYGGANVNAQKEVVGGSFDSYAKNVPKFDEYNITDELRFFANKYDNVMISKVVTYIYRINVRVERVTNDTQANKKFFEEQGKMEKVRLCVTNKLAQFSIQGFDSTGVPWRNYTGRNRFKFVTYSKPETYVPISEVTNWSTMETKCKAKNKVFQATNPFYIGLLVSGAEPKANDTVQAQVKYVNYMVKNIVYLTFCKRKGKVTF